MTLTVAGLASAAAAGTSRSAAISAVMRALGMAGDDSPAFVKQALARRRRNPPTMLKLARREPSAVLLLVQLGGLLLYPFMEGDDLRRSLFSLFGIVVLGLVLLAVRSS